MTPEQRKIITTIIRTGRRMGASRKEILSALATGGAESHWTNPDQAHSDRDSAGWRQERAQYYKNPRNIRAATKRYYQEAFAERGKGESVTQLAQAVQQSGNPGAYAAYVDDAKRLLKRGGGGSRNDSTKYRMARYDIKQGESFQDERTAAFMQYLQDKKTNQPHRILDLAMTLRGIGKDTSDELVKTRKGKTIHTEGNDVLRRSKVPQAWKGKQGGIYEVFHDPLGKYWDSGGVHKGGIGGHTDHVHVSADRGYIVELGHLAQRMGLHVGEHPRFGGVAPVHTNGSYHYKRMGIDVSGDAGKMRQFARLMMREARKGHGR